MSPCHRLKMVQADYSGRPECTPPCSHADESLGLLLSVQGVRVNRIHSKMLMDIQGRIYQREMYWQQQQLREDEEESLPEAVS